MQYEYIFFPMWLSLEDNSTRLDGFLRAVVSLELLICSLNTCQCLELLRVAFIDCYSTHDQGFGYWNSKINKLATFTLNEVHLRSTTTRHFWEVYFCTADGSNGIWISPVDQVLKHYLICYTKVCIEVIILEQLEL